VIKGSEASSESAKEFHYGGVISPPLFGSTIAASWITGGEGLSFSGEVRFRIDIGCVERNMAKPCPDCVEIHSGAKQVSRSCVT
jgi:hypothetical protein